jgi:DNA helicase-2/ATP-dependent DNA helicase PcrA
VFLVGLADGMLPIVYADTPERVEEERRLFYVGVTRARRDLSLSWSRSRAPGGRANRTPSRFLVELGGPTVATAKPTSTGKRKNVARCRSCGRTLVTGPEALLGRCDTCPADLDADLYDRLREWRLAVANHRSVPAYVVFTDRTLQALAELRPTDTGELAEIAGIGPRKLADYGPDLLALVGGAHPSDIPLPEARPIA